MQRNRLITIVIAALVLLLLLVVLFRGNNANDAGGDNTAVPAEGAEATEGAEDAAD